MSNIQTQVDTQQQTKIKYPSRYNVIVHNDDFTPMEFVIQLLVEIFNKNLNQAKDLTAEVHEKGQAVAGTYSLEVAEQKVQESAMICHHHGHPLKITYEPV